MGCGAAWSLTASPEVCGLCGGEGEVDPRTAARWETEQLEQGGWHIGGIASLPHPGGALG